MHPKIIAKKIIDFNKSNFDNTFEAVNLLQDHSERMVDLFLEKATLFPEDGKKVIKEWLESFKKGRKDFKDAVDNSFKSVENYFENNMYTMDFSFCGFQANADDSLNAVNDASKKASGAVPQKSMQVITMTGDKDGKTNETIKKRKKTAGKPGIGLVRATGKKIKK
jgi:polyhydroxyalkanoate synthesis regulator phasin